MAGEPPNTEWYTRIRTIIALTNRILLNPVLYSNNSIESQPLKRLPMQMVSVLYGLGLITQLDLSRWSQTQAKAVSFIVYGKYYHLQVCCVKRFDF